MLALVLGLTLDKWEIKGLPSGSGLRLSGSVLSGKPSKADFKQKSIDLTLTITDSEGLKLEELFTMEIRGKKPEYLEIPVEKLVAQQGVRFNLPIGSYFKSPHNDPLTFEVAGLPEESGLTWQASAKTISGTPTQAARDQSPLPITVYVYDPDNQQDLFLNQDIFLEIEEDPDPAPQIIEEIAYISMQQNKEFEGFELKEMFLPHPDGRQYTFKVKSGLPAGSGIKVGSDGKVTGRPNQNDFDSQPFEVLFTASGNRNKDTDARFLVNIDPPQLPEFLGPINVQQARQGDDFNFAVKEFFVHPSGEELTFSWIEAPPSGTGLKLNTKTGEITGRPSDKDRAVQPLSLRVRAEDKYKSGVEGVLQIEVQEPWSAPVASAISDTSAQFGQAFEMKLAEFFEHPNGLQITYTLSGLPGGSGLQFDANSGVLSGKLGDADKGASPMTLKVTATDERGQKTDASFKLEVSERPGPQTIGILDPLVGQVNVLLVPVDVSASFSHPANLPLKFSLQGAPTDTGIMISPSGVISGTPSEGDLKKTSITVVAKDEFNSKAEAPLTLSIQGELNTPPRAVDALEGAATAGDSVKIDLSALFRDDEGQSLTITADRSRPMPAIGLVVQGNFLEGVLKKEASGRVSIPLLVKDSKDLSITPEFFLNVAPLGAPPTIQPPTMPPTVPPTQAVVVPDVPEPTRPPFIPPTMSPLPGAPPTPLPTNQPTPQPTTPQPTAKPTNMPTSQPTRLPTSSPTAPTTPNPTAAPTTPFPTAAPTTPFPTTSPTTASPTPQPTHPLEHNHYANCIYQCVVWRTEATEGCNFGDFGLPPHWPKVCDLLSVGPCRTDCGGSSMLPLSVYDELNLKYPAITNSAYVDRKFSDFDTEESDDGLAVVNVLANSPLTSEDWDMEQEPEATHTGKKKRRRKKKRSAPSTSMATIAPPPTPMPTMSSPLIENVMEPDGPETSKKRKRRKRKRQSVSDISGDDIDGGGYDVQAEFASARRSRREGGYSMSG